MTIIKATFTGTNSLGYENGKRYSLKVTHSKQLNIERRDGTGKCTYATINAFLKNWDNIVVPRRDL